ncbi:hypothetical protein [Burkholderia ubonensis]|nr:hypothetical protein [Burkholderia ubonensis]
MKHKNGTTGASMAVDRHADVRGLSMFSSRCRADLLHREQVEARTAIDDAMQSVGQVLEAALQAMSNLRAARAALARSGDGSPTHQDAGEAGKAG